MNVTLRQAEKEYLAHMASRRGTSPSTQRASATAIRMFIDTVGDMQIASLQPKHVDKWFNANPTWKANTSNARLGHLNRFFKWAVRCRYMRADRVPTEGLRYAKKEPDTLTRIPADQFDDLIRHTGVLYTRAVIATGLFTMARASEIATIKVADLDLDGRWLEITRWKTKQTDRLPMALELAPHLRAYLTWYSERVNLTPGVYLFPSRQGKPGINQFDWNDPTIFPYQHATPGGLTQMAQRHIESYGIHTRHNGMHTLRRSGATALYRSLIERGQADALEVVQHMLGHSDPATTQRYLGTSFARRRRDDVIRDAFMFPELVAEQDAADTVTSLTEWRSHG